MLFIFIYFILNVLFNFSAFVVNKNANAEPHTARRKGAGIKLIKNLKKNN